EVATVVDEAQAEGPADLAGTAQQPALRAMVAAGAHDLDPGQRLQRPQQHRAGGALGPCRDVEAVVHSVSEVNVGVAGRAEHHGIPRGTAAEDRKSTRLNSSHVA